MSGSVRPDEPTDLEARPLPGTDRATAVFWSPSGRSLAFLADDKLKRFDLPDGPAVTLSDLPEARHGTWGADDVILYGHGEGTAIYAVPAAGGAPWPVVKANPSIGDVRVHWPWFLPDSKRFLFTARRDDREGELRIGQLDRATRPIMRVSSNAQWVEPNVVVFAHEGVLMAQRVDLKRAAPDGEPFSIADQVEYLFTTSRAMFSASQTGTIAYHPGGNLMQLVWADRNGNESGTVGKPADYAQSTRLSRDGRKLLTAHRQRGLGGYDIWRHDLVSGTGEQLTFGRGSEVTPVWIDGERAILFGGDSPGSLPHLFRRDLASGSEKQLLPPGPLQQVMDVLPGGRAVAYAELQGAGVFKLFQLPLTEGASPAPLLRRQFNSFGMRVSPDGRAIAFRAEGQGGALYVAPFPITSNEPQLAATEVRSEPRWSADSRQLFYVGSDRRMMTVPVRTGPPIWCGIAQQLFALKPSASLLEVSPDGRFLLLVPHVFAPKRPIVIGTAMINPSQQ